MGEKMSPSICNSRICYEIKENQLCQNEWSDSVDLGEIFLSFILDFQYRKFVKISVQKSKFWD